MKTNRQMIGWLIVTVVLSLVATFFGVRYPLPEPPAPALAAASANVLKIPALQTSNWIQNGGPLTQIGPATFSDDLTVAGDVSGAGWVGIGAQTAISLTAGMTITPTGTLQPITSATPITTSTSLAIANGAVVGELLILRNANASSAITIDGTGGNVECQSNKALGAGDILSLIWNGADWNCIALADN